MADSIKESTDFVHLVAEGVPEEAAWTVVWIDRAYRHLVKNGMPGAQAYAQAVSTYSANRFNLAEMSPELVITRVLGGRVDAHERFGTLDPERPEASYFLRRWAVGKA